MRKDTAVFIITHGRAEKQLTLDLLRQSEYSGKIYLVVDNKDEQLSEYKKKYGDMLLVFDKKKYAKGIDTHINSFGMNSALFARNACVDFARQLTFKYYFVCDDDIKCVKFKDGRAGKLKTQVAKNIERIFSAMVRYMENAPLQELGIIPDNTYIGGVNNSVKRGIKWNVCQIALFKTASPVTFKSIMWEDVATLSRDIKTGKIEFSPMFLSQCTPANGTNEGGCKKMYENSSDYANSFMVLLDRPDAIKIEFKKGKFMMRSNHAAMHPCIIHERYRKERDDA